MAGARGYPRHPERVLASALYAGLSALYRLADQMSDDYDPTAYQLFVGIREMWQETREELQALDNDLTPLFNIEPNMRKNLLGMLWHLTKYYGNSEFKRVYRWTEGTIGPLNALLNYAGAQLRTVAMRLFPMPAPTYYQIREHPDGTIQRLHRSTAMKHPAGEKIRTHWIAAYPGNSTHPDFRLRHPTLPELDLIDMVRAHVVEIVRQCFIHNVPRRVSHSYIRRLIHRLAPFVEWKYTEGSTGRKDFWPDADRELKRIVTEIQAVYGRRIGRMPRATQQLDDIPSNVTVKIIEEQTQRAENRDTSKEMRQTVAALRAQIKKRFITDQDAQAFVDDLTHRAALEGNRWHRFLANGFYQPNSLSEVVFHADKHQRALSDILVAFEVPVPTSLGSGKADIVVFSRQTVDGQSLWIPIMVLDVKTKTAMDWAPYSKEPRTEDDTMRVLVTDISKRPLTDIEWDRTMKSVLQKTNRTQLQLYSEGILSELKRFIDHPELVPKNLWSGIITLDTSQQYDEIGGMIGWFIRAIVNGLRDSPREEGRPTLYQVTHSDSQLKPPKIGVVLDEPRGPLNLLRSGTPPSELEVQDPFEERMENDRFLTLYLTVASPVSSGESAARMARNWHLLQYLQELTNTDTRPQIVWLDLFGEYPTLDLTLSRFRTTGALSPRGLDSKSMTQLRNLVRGVDFVDLSEAVDGILEGSVHDALEDMKAGIQGAFSEREGHSVIVLSGWSDLRELMPQQRSHLLKILERKVLEWLPDKNCELIWLDRPVPLPTTSAVYQMHEVAPLPYDSLRRQELDVIIWNKPTRPRFMGWRSPMLEYVRIIEVDMPTSMEPSSDLFVVPHLHGWGRRFRADTDAHRRLREEDVWELVHGPRYARGQPMADSYRYSLMDEKLEEDLAVESLCLSPSLLRPRTSGDTDRMALLRTDLAVDGLKLQSRVLPKTSRRTSIMDRVRLLSGENPPRRNRWGDDSDKKYDLVENITRARVHREGSRRQVNVHRTVRPPVIGPTYSEIDTRQTRLDEIKRMKDACRVVYDALDIEDGDYWLLTKRLIDWCSSALETPENHDPIELLMMVRDELSTRKESKALWWSLRSLRKEDFVNEGLPLSARKAIDEAMKPQPLLWELYGNDIFILLLGVWWTNEDLHFSHLQTLWRAYAEWQYIHLGLKPHAQVEVMTQSHYDPGMVFDEMNQRSAQLVTFPTEGRMVHEFRGGLLIDTEGEHEWLVWQAEPGSDKLFLACTKELNHEPLQKQFYDCVRNPSEFGGAWRGGTYVEDTQTVVITRVGEEDILWTYHSDEYEMGYWWPEGVFTYGQPPADQLGPVRWFKLLTIPHELRELVKEPEENPDPVDLIQLAEESIQPLLKLGSKVNNVTCLVTIDEDKERYVLEIYDGRGRGDQEKKTPVRSVMVEKTRDLLRRIRSPRDSGQAFEGKYWWDHRTEVDYDEQEVSSGNLSLSFLVPFVLGNRWRSRLLNEIPLPELAKDLLSTELGHTIALVADPKLGRMKSASSRCWNLLLLAEEQSDLMKSLSRVDLNIFEIAQFFEGTQFVDMTTGMRHDTKIAINRLRECKIPTKVLSYNRIARWLQYRAYPAEWI